MNAWVEMRDIMCRLFPEELLEVGHIGQLGYSYPSCFVNF